MTTPELILLVTRSIPQELPMSGLETDSQGIRITIDGKRYKITRNISVEEVGDGFLTHNDAAILLEQSLQQI